MLFDDFSGLLRILFVGIVAYAALVTFLRISGKRTLSKMNAFDLVVTVALGSTLATVVLSKDVPLAEGLLALALLIALQWVVAWGSTRSQRVSELVKSEPQILYHRGKMIEGALKRERVTPEEIAAAARGSGYGELDEVETVLLETDGSFSVIGRRND
ncbi:MAG TPA: YetF domain-containing protein [Aestuariivirgaceae bacterium]|nr:YetF domain-containing protein [Aestuariivirgaceae bacterium]